VQVLQLAAQHGDVHASLGLHPWKVATRSEHWLQALRGLLDEHRDAGIGEVRGSRISHFRPSAVITSAPYHVRRNFTRWLPSHSRSNIMIIYLKKGCVLGSGLTYKLS